MCCACMLDASMYLYGMCVCMYREYRRSSPYAFMRMRMHTLKGMACRTRITLASSHASPEQREALTSPACHARGCASPFRLRCCHNSQNHTTATLPSSSLPGCPWLAAVPALPVEIRAVSGSGAGAAQALDKANACKQSDEDSNTSKQHVNIE